MDKIAIAADHAGFELKAQSIVLLKSLRYKVVDYGTNSAVLAVDYPDYAKIVCENILENNADYGILICGSGIGMSIAANRFSSIRAALCLDQYMAFVARAHNNANILILGARITSFDVAQQIIIKFFTTKFEGARHVNRLEKLS
jgi:ribose 5-phosphate isomerase B